MPRSNWRRCFADDRREHADVPPVGTPAYTALRMRDEQRRARADELLGVLRTAGQVAPLDLYHAAWLFNHGDTAAEARYAHALAREAADLGYRPARWLAAAAYDRSCMYAGQPQRYGTQFVPDGVRYRLWDVEDSTTDAEREAWDVPALVEQVRRAEELTRNAAQPPLDGAPDWLTAAIMRWRVETRDEDS